MHQKFINLQDLLDYVRPTNGNEPKAICEIGELPAQLVTRIQDVIGVNTEGFQLTLDHFGIRHAFNGHSQERGSQDQHPLVESDILTLPKWIFSPEVVRKGTSATSLNQPLRLLPENCNAQRQMQRQMQRQIKTVVVVEVRPRYRRLVLVTMYKV